MPRLVKALLILPFMGIGLMIFFKSLDYYSPDFRIGYLSDKAAVFHGLFKYGLYAHIATAPLILLIGSYQIFFRPGKSNPRFHQRLGQLYTALIVFVAGPGGFILSFYSYGGWVGRLSFLLLSILWISFTVKGFLYGRQRFIKQHRRYMVRSFVLTLSAVFLRLLSFITIHYWNFTGEKAYAIMAWSCWLPFIVGVEIIFFMEPCLMQPLSKESSTNLSTDE